MLSARETEVMKLLSEGCRIKDISKKLHISIPVVKEYFRKIRTKTGAKTLAQAVFNYYKEEQCGT